MKGLGVICIMYQYFDWCRVLNGVVRMRQVDNLEGLRSVVEGYLHEFNNMSKKPMNLVMFK